MRLSDLVQIDSRFEKSVNLLLDLNDKKKIDAYIPTRASINLIKGYLEEVTGFSGKRANILIGPYGKGKSHLLLILTAVISGNRSKELDSLLKRVAVIDPEAAELMSVVNSSYRFLPVIINTNSGNLGQAFVRSLNQALKREGLDDVVPENYFSEAVNTIKQWKKIYPATYEELEKRTGVSGKEFIHKLESYNYEVLDQFRAVHPLITSGSEFNPIVDDEPLSVFRSINKTLREKHGFAGIYIIFDEFSKYIEGHTEAGFSADMKLLQDICELCNSSSEEQLHLTCVAHKAIRTYRDSISKRIMNSFLGVEGRLVEIPFYVSAQNNYELIADAVTKKEAFESWRNNRKYVDLLDKSYLIPEFSALFEKNDFDTIVGDGCFPLTPLSALLLLNLSEKIAQNERTIFTFISGSDMHSLASYINHGADKYAGADLIYDYFLPLFEGEKGTAVQNEWLKADFALSKTEGKEEGAIIKCLAVIRMINRSDDIPANGVFLRLALGMDEGIFNDSLNGLIKKGLIAYKKSNAVYDFQNNIGINVENEVADCAIKYYSKTDIPTALNSICNNRYILPKKYNQSHFMTRYYRVLFMSATSFMALSSSDYLKDDNYPDGYLIEIYMKEQDDIKALQNHLKEIGDKRIVLGVPGILCDCDEEVKTLLAVRKLLGDHDFTDNNEVLITELKVIERDLLEQLNAWMENAESSITTLFFENETIPISYYGINRAVSDVCEKTYNCTPIINHELINRHVISPQIHKARNAIMDDMLHAREIEKYETGTSAESTIFRALMVHSKGDKNMDLIKDSILGFIHESKGKKQPFSKLLKELTSEPYGMRKGPIPVYVMEQLTALEDMPVVYMGKKELAIDAALLANVVQKPEDYYLYVEEETGQKLEYIESLEKTFEEYSLSCRGIENRNRLSKLTCIIQAWYRALPQASKTFRKADYEGQSMNEIEAFRKLFAGAVNPREVLFDQIPSLFNANNLVDASYKVNKIKQEIDDHIQNIKNDAILAVRDGLCLNKDEDLLRSIKEWYTVLPSKAKNSVFATDSQRLFREIKDLDCSDSYEIAEKLSKTITGFFIEDWTDKSIELFRHGFADLNDEIGRAVEEENTAVGQRVFFETDNGMLECRYDFDPDSVSSSGYFFQNALDDLMEEYGEAIETSEKIGILMQIVKKLMG